MRVALFITCFNDTLFPETGIAMTRLLERLGCEGMFGTRTLHLAEILASTEEGI
jgi:L-lactate dehydrogenase complex protein LldE